jgi:hypothetical protein
VGRCASYAADDAKPVRASVAMDMAKDLSTPRSRISEFGQLVAEIFPQ